MDKYTVTAVSARLSSGVLELTKEQAAPRLHNLKSQGKGLFEVVNPVEFKRGEVIGYDGDLPKALGDKLEVEEKAASKKRAAAEAKAKAEAEAKDQEEAEARAKAEVEAENKAKE